MRVSGVRLLRNRVGKLQIVAVPHLFSVAGLDRQKIQHPQGPRGRFSLKMSEKCLREAFQRAAGAKFLKSVDSPREEWPSNHGLRCCRRISVRFDRGLKFWWTVRGRGSSNSMFFRGSEGRKYVAAADETAGHHCMSIVHRVQWQRVWLTSEIRRLFELGTLETPLRTYQIQHFRARF